MEKDSVYRNSHCPPLCSSPIANIISNRSVPSVRIVTNPTNRADAVTELSEYKNLAVRWHNWQTVKTACSILAIVIFDRVCELDRMSKHRA